MPSDWIEIDGILIVDQDRVEELREQAQHGYEDGDAAADTHPTDLKMARIAARAYAPQLTIALQGLDELSGSEIIDILAGGGLHDGLHYSEKLPDVYMHSKTGCVFTVRARQPSRLKTQR